MNTLQLDTDLTNGQVRKFSSFFKSMIIVDHRSYFSTSEMHGVLLTRSKAEATNKLENQLSYITNYLKNINDDRYIKLIGVDILLDRLCEVDPRKQHQYLASKAVINTWAANNAEIFKDGQLRAIEKEHEQVRVMQWVKRNATHCLLSGKSAQEVQLDIHHIFGAAEKPELATEVHNLIPLSKDIHKAYHSWVLMQGGAVNRASLKRFALIHRYSTSWDWPSEAISPVNP